MCSSPTRLQEFRISSRAADLLLGLLEVNPKARLSAAAVLSHPWLTEDEPSFSSSLFSLPLQNTSVRDGKDAAVLDEMIGAVSQDLRELGRRHIQESSSLKTRVLYSSEVPVEFCVSLMVGSAEEGWTIELDGDELEHDDEESEEDWASDLDASDFDQGGQQKQARRKRTGQADSVTDEEKDIALSGLFVGDDSSSGNERSTRRRSSLEAFGQGSYSRAMDITVDRSRNETRTTTSSQKFATGHGVEGKRGLRDEDEEHAFRRKRKNTQRHPQKRRKRHSVVHCPPLVSSEKGMQVVFSLALQVRHP